MIQKGVREQPKISLNIFTLEERFEVFIYIYIYVMRESRIYIHIRDT